LSVTAPDFELGALNITRWGVSARSPCSQPFESFIFIYSYFAKQAGAPNQYVKRLENRKIFLNDWVLLLLFMFLMQSTANVLTSCPKQEHPINT
jgi:hypothetical protein